MYYYCLIIAYSRFINDSTFRNNTENGNVNSEEIWDPLTKMPLIHITARRELLPGL